MLPLEEVSNKLAPLQKVVPDELINGTVGVFLVITTGAEVPVQPRLFVMVTENVPAFAVYIFCVVAPFDQI